MIKRLLWWPILQIERFYTFLRYWRRYEDDEGTLTLSYSKKLNDSTVKSRYNYVYRYDWEKDEYHKVNNYGERTKNK